MNKHTLITFGAMLWTPTIVVLGQSPPNLQSFSYSHGTCLIVTWRDPRLAIAEDTQYVETSDRPSATGSYDLGTTGKMCKLRQTAPYILLTMDGTEKVLNDRNEVVWDGLDIARRLFEPAESRTTVGQLLNTAALWQSTFERLIDLGAINKRDATEDQVVTQLHVLGYFDAKPIVITARFIVVAGQIAKTAPYLVPDPQANEVKVLKYGSCNKHLGDNVSRADLTVEELKRYTALRMDEQPRAATGSELTILATDYVKLGADISAREATHDHPADVGLPIVSAVINPETGSWSFTRPIPDVCFPFAN